jgi:hypothetical protein
VSLPDARRSFLWLIDILRRERIDFAVTGGLAARSYGAARALNDIDIDIRNADFWRLHAAVFGHVVFGPARYRDEKWDLLLMMLDHEGQIIDIAGGDDARIYDKARQAWITSRTDFADVEIRDVLGLAVPVMSPEALVAYKAMLDGACQQTDIEAIGRFLKARAPSS